MVFRGAAWNIFSGIDIIFFAWLLIFLIFFAVTNKIFTKFFKTQRKLGTIIAFLTSIAIVYFTNLKYSYFVDNMIYGLGIDLGVIMDILPWVFLAIAILIIFKFGIGMLLMLFGAFMILSGWIGFAEQQSFAIMAGVIAFLIGVFFWKRRKRKIRGLPRRNPLNTMQNLSGRAHKRIGRGVKSSYNENRKYRLDRKKVKLEEKNRKFSRKRVRRQEWQNKLERLDQKEAKRSARREEELQKWYNRGKKIGNKIGSGAYHSKRALERAKREYNKIRGKTTKIRETASQERSRVQETKNRLSKLGLIFSKR